jgi:hypothetical protein
LIFVFHVEAREELLTIGSSRWDDLVDSLAYAESIIQPVYFSMDNREKWHEPIRRKIEGYGLEY